MRLRCKRGETTDEARSDCILSLHRTPARNLSLQVCGPGFSARRQANDDTNFVGHIFRLRWLWRFRVSDAF